MTHTDTSEKYLETLLVNYLRDHNGYEEGTSDNYNKDYALDTERVKRFIITTQKNKADNCACFASDISERRFFTELNKQLAQKGIIHLLRQGFRYIAEQFDLYYPLPSELNPTAKKLYHQNIFCVTRQLYYSKDNNNSIDILLSINGLPLLTIELKNHLSGQNVNNAIHQYQNDRDPHDPLLAPARCAVHLAVDDDEIRMCTTLCGKASWFLPFNKGVNGGAGNPINPNGVRTAYLWEEILQKESLSDIIEHYAQVITTKDAKTGKNKTSIIWPRYHQLEVVRALLQQTREKGIRQRFLIQHSAGSGKSNSITWLAYQLVGLLQGTTPLLDSVIIVTDRVNLDRQIRNNIKAFPYNPNIVEWADSAETLRTCLASGKKIIITTIYKFSFILDAIGSTLKHKRFGIIIDEAHSSQSGSLSANMNIALSGGNTNTNNDSNNQDKDLEDILHEIINGRKMLENANYYAFTATPKNKTLQMFGTPYPKPDGEIERRPFHEYTMKQAIEEGFIMDVLSHYTTYPSYYKIIKTIADDPLYDKKKAQKILRAFVEKQPETIHEKAAIIVEHFHTKIIEKGKIGGQARAMVVTSSIQRAVQLYYEINHLLQERRSPYKAIVAFSGTTEYGGKLISEADANGFPSKDIEDNMGRDPYRILVVADKFQTGYDQPLLHTMYVDKVLTDVKAVQTLSRLNRCHPKKIDTFVLDFANDTDSIQASFQRFYKTTILSKEMDPNRLNDLIQTIEDTYIYTQSEIEDLNRLYYSNAPREQLDPILNTSVERFKKLDEDTQVCCKSSIKTYCRNYPFFAAVLPDDTIKWERLYTYLILLVHKLPILKQEDFTQGLIDSIDFDQYRIVRNEEKQIELENTNATIEPPTLGNTQGKTEPELAKLSDILGVLNDSHWKNRETAKKQLIELPAKIRSDAHYVNAALNSDRETAQQQFNTSFKNILENALMENSELYLKLFQDKSLYNFIAQRIFDITYQQIRQ